MLGVYLLSLGLVVVELKGIEGDLCDIIVLSPFSARACIAVRSSRILASETTPAWPLMKFSYSSAEKFLFKLIV